MYLSRLHRWCQTDGGVCGSSQELNHPPSSKPLAKWSLSGQRPSLKNYCLYTQYEQLRAGISLMSIQAQERTRGNPEGEHHVPSLRLVIVWHLLACQNVYPF